MKNLLKYKKLKNYKFIYRRIDGLDFTERKESTSHHPKNQERTFSNNLIEALESHYLEKMGKKHSTNVLRKGLTDFAKNNKGILSKSDIKDTKKLMVFAKKLDQHIVKNNIGENKQPEKKTEKS